MQHRWDAGELGCGQLVLQLSKRVNELEAGETIEVVARDPGAPVDLPAWCRMTGHRLISEDHPTYIIQRSSS